jgi:hypothetical protein
MNDPALDSTGPGVLEENMPYLVTAKLGGLELRDGTLATDKMHKLEKGVSVLFEHCPAGYTPPGDAQIEVLVAGPPKANPAPIPMEVTPPATEEPAPIKRHRKHRE